MYSTNCKIRLTDLGTFALVDESDANFTIIPTVSNIAALKTKTDGGVFKITGEVIISFIRTANRNQKYIQDATGGILIDDPTAKITTAYSRFDGITGLSGTLATYSGSGYSIRQIVPIGDPGAASSTGNTLTPVLFNLADKLLLTTDYESMLVKVANVSITPTGTFAATTNYTLSDGTNTIVMRTLNAAESDIDGSAIPTGKVTITGLATEYSSTGQLYPTYLAEIQSADATLFDLTVGGATVTGFASTTYTYNVEVPYGEAAPVVGATATDDGIATVDITQALDANGEATVVVTAEDGITELTYTVDFTEAAPSTDATLSAFTVDTDNILTLANISVADPGTDAGAIQWVSDFTGYAGIAITKNHSGASFEVKLNDVLIDPADYATQAIVNNDQLVVTVTAQDGTTKGYYKVKFRTQPTLSITDPTPAQIIGSSTYDVVFDVQNFVLNTDGKVKWTLDAGAASYVTASPISLSGLDGGDHTIAVELVDMDEVSLVPAVTDDVTFNVQLSNDATLGTFTLGGVNMLGLAGVSGDLETLAGASYEKLDFTGFAGIVADPNGASATYIVKLNESVVDPANYATQALSADDVVLIDVTAQDGSTHKYYKVTLAQAVRSLTIDTPLGESTIYTGDTYTFTWTAEWVDNIDIDMTTDNGSSWIPVESNYAAAGGTYTTAAVQNGEFGTVRFKITSVEDGSVSDETPNVVIIDDEIPVLDSKDPVDDATDISITPTITLTFNENIQKGTGNIKVFKTSDDSEVFSVDVTNAAVSINGAEVSLTLSGLSNSTEYYVNVDAGSIKDIANNNFAGISDKVSWSFTTIAQADLFFSEYIEGGSYNKALEIYNPTGSTVDLNSYALKGTSNSATGWENTYLFPAGATISAYSVYVISDYRANASILNVADWASSGFECGFNGDDARGLFKIVATDTILIDLIGYPNNPTPVKYDAAGILAATENHTLVRKNAIVAGTTDWAASAGTDADNSEWIVYAVDNFDYIGWHKVKSDENDILTFTLAEQTGAATINDVAHTVEIEVAKGTDVTALVPTITVSKYATINPASNVAQNFTNPVDYSVTAQDGTNQIWGVTVTIFKSNDASLSDIMVDAVSIDGFSSTTFTYNVNLPYGTTVTPVVTVTKNDADADALIDAATDITSATEADRTTIITVTAEDGLTVLEYKVIFNVTPASTDATLSNLTVATGTLNPAFASGTYAYTVALPFGSTVTPVVTPTENDPNANAVVTDATDITSATEADRTTTITVTAEDGTTELVYTVVFNVTPALTGKSIITYSFAEQTGDATIGDGTIDIEVANTTNRNNLVATFTISEGASIAIGANPQVSGTTSNDFTDPVTYVVTAQDASTKDWVVTVTNATTLSDATDILTFSVLGVNATVNNTNHTVTAELPYGTDRTALVATFTTSTGSSVKVEETAQTSGVTANDFTNAVIYTITAEDGTTTQDWTVTITNEAPSADATLSDLKVDGTTISDFAGGTLAYTYELPYGTTAIPVVTATTTDANANAVITPATDVTSTVADSRTTKIDVTAQDGTTIKNYTVLFNVNPGSDDATVTSTEYNVNSTYNIINMVPQGTLLATFEANLTPATGADFDTYMGDSVTVATDLQDGYIVKVIAQNGTTIKYYTVLIPEEPVETALYEGFEYIVGDTLGVQVTNWEFVNSGDSIVVKSGSLTYPGLVSSKGNSISFAGKGLDYYLPIDKHNTGTVYYSFIFKVTDVSLATEANGGYFTGLGATSTIFGSTVWTKKEGDNFKIGINTRTSTSVTQYSSNTFAVNSEIFVVVGYQFNSGTGNDVSKIWINPAQGTLGDEIEPTPDITLTNTGGTDLDSIKTFFIRQDSDTETPAIEFDEARIGMSWADVTPSLGASAEAEILSFELAEQYSEAVFDTTAGTIDIEVLFGTDVTDLVPTIEVSSGAHISPESDVAQDFTNPVVYTVTAKDYMTTKDWTVTVTINPTANDDAEILSFEIADMDSVDINLTDTTIIVYMPDGTDVSALTPTFTISSGANVDITSGTVKDFTNPVTYTVTAQNTTNIMEWVVTVIVNEIQQVSIHDIQYATLAPYDSPYKDQILKTTGLVVGAKTGTSTTNLFIQDGSGAWSGLYAYESTTPVVIGDSVRITATVKEYYNLTELKYITNLTVINSGNEVPDPTEITIGDVAEQYEGVFVKIMNVECITAPNSFKEWEITDGIDTMLVDDLLFDFTPTVGSVYHITGLVDYAFNKFRIVPRNADDVVENMEPQITAVILNPTNPTTSQAVTVTATITDDYTSALELEVALYWGTSEGSETNEVSFNRLGFSGNDFQGIIPAQSVSTIYYLIEAIDDAWISEYTGSYSIVTGINDPESFVQMHIFPNPNSGQFTIELNAQKAGKFDIEIVNVLGQVVYQKQIEQDGTYKDVIDISDKAKGLYYIRINDGKSTKVQKLIIQ